MNKTILILLSLAIFVASYEEEGATITLYDKDFEQAKEEFEYLFVKW
jgi:hypothetical protein